MRAMVVRRYGPPEVFEYSEVPDPQPAAGQVLVRVRAVGVNFADLLQRMGIYPGTPKLPFIPGFEVAGIVEQVSSSTQPPASDLAPGARVVALATFSAYAERSEEHTSELQSRLHLVCRLLLEKKKNEHTEH